MVLLCLNVYIGFGGWVSYFALITSSACCAEVLASGSPDNCFTRTDAPSAAAFASASLSCQVRSQGEGRVSVCGEGEMT